jgi:hypothetical protein
VGHCWDAVPPDLVGNWHPDQLDEKLFNAIVQGPLQEICEQSNEVHVASMVLLYMYLHLQRAGKRYSLLLYPLPALQAQLFCRPLFNFTTQSTLPISVGLGSSASFSICAATTLLLLDGWINIPFLQAPMSTGCIHIANQGQHIIPLNVAQDMHCWTFIAENNFTENILQYNPSVINNVTAVFEWALAFTGVGMAQVLLGLCCWEDLARWPMWDWQCDHHLWRGYGVHKSWNWEDKWDKVGEGVSLFGFGMHLRMTTFRFQLLRLLLTDLKAAWDANKLINNMSEKRAKVHKQSQSWKR